MELFGEILKYTLPALIVLAASFLTLRALLKNEEQKRRAEKARESQQFMNPLRLQAYERITLFLERISPEALIFRVSQNGMTSLQLHTELLSTIRAEFEHNLTQQIYVSDTVWEHVKQSRNQIVQLINLSVENIDPKAPAIVLSKRIIENAAQRGKSPQQFALEELKKEVRTLF
jgi:hypothetical protein